METDLLVIFIVVIILLTVLSMAANFRRVQRDKVRAANFKRAELEKRAQQAIWAGATIATARHHTADGEMRESVRVDLTLQVQPPHGEPYTARTAWRVKHALLAQFQPGASLSIKIDRDDPDLIFPNQPGAEYWG